MVTKRGKRLPVLALAVVMLFAIFSGCSKKEGNDDPEKSPGTNPSSEFVYVPKYLNVKADVESINRMVASPDGKSVYVVGYGVIGQGVWTDNEGAEPMPAVDDVLAVAAGESTVVSVGGSSGVVIDTPAEPEATDSEAGTDDPNTYDIWGTKLYVMDVDSQELKELENYKPLEIPEGMQGSADINTLCVTDEGKLLVVESLYTYSYDADGVYQEGENKSIIRVLDNTGAELSQIDLAEISKAVTDEGGYFYVQGLAAGADGMLFFSDGNQTLYAMDSTGKLAFKLESENWINAVVSLGNGKVGITTYGGSGMVIKPVDVAAKTWGSDIPLPMNVYDIYPGSNEYDLYYSDNSNFYGYKLDSKESTTLLNWIDSDINTNNMNAISVLNDGRILCLMYNWDSEGSNIELAVMTKTPASEVVQKTKLTLATLYLSYELRNQVINFNKTNEKYRISVVDYSAYNTEDDYEAGLTKLSTEIISGNVPDLLDVQSLPMAQYAAKGLLEDLYPYIDNDPELERADLMEDVLRAMEINGKLYQASSTFSVQTLIANADVAGAEPGWTIDDVMNIMKSAPAGTEFMRYMTRSNILQYALMFDMDSYVNWETGECNFDNENFAKLLEFAKTFPKEIDWDNVDQDGYVDERTLIATGKLVTTQMYIYSYDDIQLYNKLLEGKMVFKGFPNAKGSNGSVISVDSGLAMTSKCKDKEGAWQFLRQYFASEEDSRYSWGLPINKARFDKLMEEAMKKEYTTDENGNKVEVPKYSYWMDNNEVQIYAATEEDINMLRDLIASCEKTMTYDTSIMEIVQEEAEYFFEGQKTAKDAASLIQGRVNIYVNEQR